MARYYFHIVSPGECIGDDRGSDCEDLGACHDQALRIIRECLPVMKGHLERERWWISIADASGESRLVVLYPCRFALRALHGLGAAPPPRNWIELRV